MTKCVCDLANVMIWMVSYLWSGSFPTCYLEGVYTFDVLSLLWKVCSTISYNWTNAKMFNSMIHNLSGGLPQIMQISYLWSERCSCCCPAPVAWWRIDQTEAAFPAKRTNMQLFTFTRIWLRAEREVNRVAQKQKLARGNLFFTIYT